jgi:hypothetical protein
LSLKEISKGMKKLLILMMVLGLTSVVSALTVRLSTDGTNASDYLEATAGSSHTIYVISNTSGSAGIYWTYLEMDLPSPVTISDVTALPAAGNLASVTDYSVSDFVDWELAAYDSAGNVLAGAQFSFSVTFASDWDGTFFAFWITTPNDENYPVEHVLGIIPEPITIALLGLGGLFLRRRK